MYKPANPLRRNIINKIVNWKFVRAWQNEPMEDAKILVEESQKVLPYTLVLQNYIGHNLALREKDQVFVARLNEIFYDFAYGFCKWLLTAPILNLALEEPPSYSADGELVINSKIRMGYLSEGNRPKIAEHFELKWLKSRYPWLDYRKTPRVIDFFSFIHQWGHPMNTISQRGRTKEDKYAFIYPTTGRL